MSCYGFFIRLFAPLVILLTIMDGVKRKAGAGFVFKRLGFKGPFLEASSKRVWIHCASVGEVKAAQPLINGILLHTSDTPILVTCNTASAMRLIDSLFQTRVASAYCPLDYPFAIRQFLSNSQPKQLIVIETEIWPNLYRLCGEAGLPITIVNGRLSQKTLKAPKWLKRSYQDALTHTQKILTRSHTDALNFIALGAQPNQVTSLGNLKFAHQHSISHYQNPLSRAFVLLASSHHDEEVQITRQWLSLKRPELLVIVPRHPHRSQHIQTALTKLTKQLAVASKNDPITERTLVYLDDRTGVLLSLYEHAALVIMGGSFVNRGGHNFIEPALYKKAILTGPYNDNFTEELALLQKANGIIKCHSYEALKRNVNGLLDQTDQRDQYGNRAFKALQTQKNILNNYLNALGYDQTSA